MYLVVNEKRLFIASEIGPSNIVYSRISPDFYRHGFSTSSVMKEHFCDFSVDIVV